MVKKVHIMIVIHVNTMFLVIILKKSGYNNDDKSNNDFFGNHDEKKEFEGSESEKEMSEYFNENIKATENWRNKGETQLNEIVKIKGKRPTKYKDGCEDIRKILNFSRLISTNKAIITNGNLLSAERIQRQRLLVSNTCAFDSLLVALAVGYMDFDNFRNYMDDLSTNNKFLKLCRDVALHGCSVSTYKTRAKILIDSGVCKHTEIQQGTSMLNCVSNVVGLSNNLLATIPSSVQSTNCSNCNEKKQFYNTTVIMEYGKNIDLTKLNDFLTIYTDSQTKICKICKNNSLVTTRKLSNHILIETDYLTENNENEYKLNDIPTEIFNQNIRCDSFPIITFNVYFYINKSLFVKT